MHFKPLLLEAVLLRRYKRFLADVILSSSQCGEVTTVHCPNTGSMKNCQPSKARVWCSISDNPKRKYPMTWELVEIPEALPSNEICMHLACINTHRTNALVEEALHNNIITELQGYDSILREVKYGNSSRIDLLLQSKDQPDCYVEVKSVTFSTGQGRGIFPDAVTERGTRHLKELTTMVSQGKRAVLIFCVQHTGINYVEPAVDIDPVYAEMLEVAYNSGVEVLAYRVDITPETMTLSQSIPVYVKGK